MWKRSRRASVSLRALQRGLQCELAGRYLRGTTGGDFLRNHLSRLLCSDGDLAHQLRRCNAVVVGVLQQEGQEGAWIAHDPAALLEVA